MTFLYKDNIYTLKIQGILSEKNIFELEVYFYEIRRNQKKLQSY